MSDRLKGKRAFVTAAAVGIGRACALAFAREGATVFATDIDEAKLAALKSEGIAEVAKLDARDSAAVAAMAKRAGKTDILLNAAGFVHHGTVLDCSDEDFDFSFDLNVKSMHRTIRSFLPGMLEAGRGTIVNICSVNAFMPDPAVIDYSAAKAALSNFSKALSKEVGPRGIRVNTVSPGPVSTGLWLGEHGVAATVAQAQGGDPAAVAERQAGEAPTGRFTEPEEVADLVVLLAGERAANVTGADFVIDGGLITTL